MPVDKPSTGPFLFVDCSNWTGPLTDQGCADLKAAGFVGCIIQAITGNDGASYTRQQLDACVRNGLRIQGYVWVNRNGSAATTWNRLALFDGYSLERLWVDIEEAGLTKADVDLVLGIADEYMGDRQYVGCYGAKWFWDQQGWTHQTWWADRPLWNADYNGIAEVGAGFVPFGGWTRPICSQFQGTSSVGSVHQVDLNVMA